MGEEHHEHRIVQQARIRHSDGGEVAGRAAGFHDRQGVKVAGRRGVGGGTAEAVKSPPSTRKQEGRPNWRR